MLGGGNNLEPGEVSDEVLPRGRAEAALVETNRLPANAGQGEGRHEGIGGARCGRRHDLLNSPNLGALALGERRGQFAMADNVIDIDGLRNDSRHVDRRHHEGGSLGREDGEHPRIVETFRKIHCGR